MKLSLQMSLVIGGLSLAISLVFAAFNYNYQLQKVTTQNQQLVQQLSDNAQTTSAIAVYLDDIELGREVVDGLANNDLIMSATIRMSSDGSVISSGTPSSEMSSINTTLFNPFIPDEIIGRLEVVPNVDFIKSAASSASRQNAYLLIGLSFFIAAVVGFYVRVKLTKPIRQLSIAVQEIDTSAPEHIKPIDIGYKNRNEISSLSSKTNMLIEALKEQFLSERELRESTEELQKRFRLLFEQATAGIGLLSSQGHITIANPAFHQLFEVDVSGKDFAQLFATPGIVKDQIKLLLADNGVSQTDIDIDINIGNEKRFLHCLFSRIEDSRAEAREESENLVEVIIYDITHRKKREEKARYEADHDSLTGLLSRRAGLEHLNHKLALQLEEQNLPGDTKQVFALMMVDLDKFKPVNDTYGHDVGDVVLTQVSQRIMTSASDPNAVNIRWGGDEFLLGVSFKLSEISDHEALEDSMKIKNQVEQLIEAISTEVVIDSSLSVQVGASVGVVLLASDKQADIEHLITRADELMYITKKQKAKRYSIVSY
ncbi:MAG: diguanylate cyclase (GGDEF)-like protein/PAS domain S-box-containing protein [Glaciecola sp.]|jgi:diguanylate cyclase (GGDEF)-like protein/PAS domain S-box-containing protein